MIYQGNSTALILQNTDSVSDEPYGLRTLRRTSVCATSWADAGRAALVIGNTESAGGRSYSIFKIDESATPAITTFTLTCYAFDQGVVQTTHTFQERAYSYAVPAVKGQQGQTIPGFSVTIQYLSPTATLKFCQVAGSAPSIAAPTLDSTARVSYTALGFALPTIQPGGTLAVQTVLVDQTIENLGAVDVVTATFAGFA